MHSLDLSNAEHTNRKAVCASRDSTSPCPVRSAGTQLLTEQSWLVNRSVSSPLPMHLVSRSAQRRSPAQGALRHSSPLTSMCMPAKHPSPVQKFRPCHILASASFATRGYLAASREAPVNAPREERLRLPALERVGNCQEPSKSTVAAAGSAIVVKTAEGRARSAYRGEFCFCSSFPREPEELTQPWHRIHQAR